jgi:hypothetical protein
MWSLYRRVEEWTNHNNMKTNHQEKSKKSITKVTHNFSPKVHVLAGTLRPRCVDHHFMVRRLIGNPKPSSPKSTTRTYRKWGNSITRAIYKSCFWRSAREGTTPLTNHREVAKNKHHSCHYSSTASKPSRWRQPPRVTRIPQPMLTQVSTRYKLISKFTWDHSNSLWFINQAREMSRREYAQLKRMLGCQKVQERLPLAGQYIFIRVPNEIESLGTKPFFVRVHRMCRCSRTGRWPASGGHPASR